MKERTFCLEYGGEGVNTGRKLLSMDEFAVIIFATSGDFRAFPEGVLAWLTSAMEWSSTGKKMIVHQEILNP